LFQDKVDFGIVQNLLAFPGWRGETVEGLDMSKRLLDDPFFGMMEIGWIANPDYRKQIRRWVIGSEKEITYGCGPVIFGEGLDLNTRDEALRIKSIDRLKQLADDALDYNAKILLITSGRNVEPERRGEAFRLLDDSLEKLCAFCREIRPANPLVVAIELFDSDIDKKMLLGSIDYAVMLASRIVRHNPNFALSLDLSHLPLMKVEAERAVHTCISFLQHIHIGNCVLRDAGHPQYGDKHPMFGIEGGENGRAEVQNFFKILESSGYATKRVPTRRPVIIAEIIPTKNDDIAKIIENIKSAIKRLP
jgi:hypothetical protein